MYVEQASRGPCRWGLAAALALALAATGPATGEGLRLADGREAVLAGIVTPDPVAGAVTLVDAAPPVLDRHGRLRSQLRGADGTWLQAELVGQGRAVVAPAADVPDAVLTELLRLEREARRAGRGLWAGQEVGPYPASDVPGPAGRFVLVEGEVRAVARRGPVTFLDFGADWRRDFTLRAETASLPAFAGAGLDVDGLLGKRILVRGWLFDHAGPMIELVHPLQIEVVE